MDLENGTIDVNHTLVFYNKNHKQTYEKKEKAGDRSGDEWMINPSPDVCYQVYLEYLAEMCKLMHQKYNEDYVWGEKSLSDE